MKPSSQQESGESCTEAGASSSSRLRRRSRDSHQKPEARPKQLGAGSKSFAIPRWPRAGSRFDQQNRSRTLRVSGPRPTLSKELTTLGKQCLY